MIDISSNLLAVLDNSTALKQQIAVFLNTRESELEYDTEMGINFEFVLSRKVTSKQLINYYTDKLLKYFSTEITKIESVEVSNIYRSRKIVIKYQSIYGKSTEIITTQMEV